MAYSEETKRIQELINKLVDSDFIDLRSIPGRGFSVKGDKRYLTVDGEYGTSTREAVTLLQQFLKDQKILGRDNLPIVPDGKWGTNTQFAYEQHEKRGIVSIPTRLKEKNKPEIKEPEGITYDFTIQEAEQHLGKTRTKVVEQKGEPQRDVVLDPKKGELFFLADVHFTGTAKSKEHVLETIRGIAERGDTIIVAGDVLAFPNGTTDERKMKSVYQELSDIMLTLAKEGIKFIPAFGNHDGPLKVASEMLGPGFGADFYGTEGRIPKGFTVKYGDTAFVCLSGRSVAELDAGYLQQTLTRLEKEGLHKVEIVTHFPIDSVSTLTPITINPNKRSQYIGQTLIGDPRFEGIFHQFQDRFASMTVISGHQHVQFEQTQYVNTKKEVHVGTVMLPVMTQNQAQFGSFWYVDPSKPDLKGQRATAGYGFYDSQTGKIGLMNWSGNEIKAPKSVPTMFAGKLTPLEDDKPMLVMR